MLYFGAAKHRDVMKWRKKQKISLLLISFPNSVQRKGAAVLVAALTFHAPAKNKITPTFTYGSFQDESTHPFNGFREGEGIELHLQAKLAHL
jgi:hypothetical protein